MTDPLAQTLLLAALAGSGLVAGLFFAFSVSVMPGLGRLPPDQGAGAMRAINVAILNPVFVVAFFGTAAVAAVVAALSVSRWGGAGVGWALGGAILYLAGAILVTMAANVPMNQRLARAAPDTGAGTTTWRCYLVAWTRWNHLRAVASIAATLCFALALRG